MDDEETLGSTSSRSGSSDEYVGEAVVGAAAYAALPPNGFVLHGGACASCAAPVPTRQVLWGAPRPYGWSVDDAESCAPFCDACLSYIAGATCRVCEAMAAPAFVDTNGAAVCIYCACVHDEPAPRAQACRRCYAVTDRRSARSGRCLICAALAPARHSTRACAPPVRWQPV